MHHGIVLVHLSDKFNEADNAWSKCLDKAKIERITVLEKTSRS